MYSTVHVLYCTFLGALRQIVYRAFWICPFHEAFICGWVGCLRARGRKVRELIENDLSPYALNESAAPWVLKPSVRFDIWKIGFSFHHPLLWAAMNAIGGRTSECSRFRIWVTVAELSSIGTKTVSWYATVCSFHVRQWKALYVRYFFFRNHIRPCDAIPNMGRQLQILP